MNQFAKVSLTDAMRRLHRTGDLLMAEAAYNHMRFKLGFDYESQIHAYAKANGLDRETAAEEWEEFMQEID